MPGVLRFFAIPRSSKILEICAAFGISEVSGISDTNSLRFGRKELISVPCNSTKIESNQIESLK